MLYYCTYRRKRCRLYQFESNTLVHQYIAPRYFTRQFYGHGFHSGHAMNFERVKLVERNRQRCLLNKKLDSSYRKNILLVIAVFLLLFISLFSFLDLIYCLLLLLLFVLISFCQMTVYKKSILMTCFMACARMIMILLRYYNM